MLQALIFDVDGTLADTEAAHREAFNAAFDDLSLPWHWDEALYIDLLDVTGGKERILHYWRMTDPGGAARDDAAEIIARAHALKTRHYEARVAGGQVALRPGIRRLIEEAYAAGIPMAIATTTTPANIDALLRAHFGADWRKRFAIVCDAETAPRKKPAPDVYFAALAGLGRQGSECIAFEDSRNGLLAARAAGIPVVITPNPFTATHCFDEALMIVPDLGEPPEAPATGRAEAHGQDWIDLAALRERHARAGAGAQRA